MELPQLASREAASHKGDYGRAVLVGGSPGMTGAIGLAGMGALRGGAGLVTLGVPAVCQQVVAAYEPCYMTWALPTDTDGRLDRSALELIKDRQDDFNCWACGPGLGRSDALVQLVAWLYENLQQPLILDADAIYALGQREEALAAPAGPRILTPHPGEFQYLKPSDKPTIADSCSREADETLAHELSRAYQVVIVLKGHQTLVTDGKESYANNTGNPGMATGGSGDVLTGLVTALVCQGLDPWQAACLGVHLHGRAGDLAAEQLGQVGMIASDLVEFLPQAIEQHVRSA